jgi:hypothetical protein
MLAFCKQTEGGKGEVTTYDLPMLSVARLWWCPSRRASEGGLSGWCGGGGDAQRYVGCGRGGRAEFRIRVG